MPDLSRSAYFFSAAFHVVILTASVVHFDLFRKPPDEEQPIVVELVNIANETRATKLTQAPPKPQEKPPEQEVAQPPPQQQASNQPRAPLGAQLTTSEIDLIKKQITDKWNAPVGAKNANEMQIEVRVVTNPDGTVRSAELLSRSRMEEPFYRSMA